MEEPRKSWSAAAQGVGTIVLGYAELENTLYLIASIVFYKAGGRAYTEHGAKRPQWRHFPENATERHQLLDTCFEKIDALASFKTTWLEIRKGLALIENKRHAMVHGVWNGEIGPEVSVTFTRFKSKKDKHQRLTLRLTLSQMSAIGKRIYAINEVSVALAECLYHLFVPKHERHKPLGSGRR
jgi:hypothetical protein